MSSSFTRPPQPQFEAEKPPFSEGMVHNVYQPAQAHWCFSKIVENKPIWFPFSLVDSLKLEEAGRNGNCFYLHYILYLGDTLVQGK